ncbi:PID-CTERM protein-sorting domain-containing protein [Hymenobacter terricola]|uniref:PID-CTERM protein-sorting domain-containing protein n=1 Tax=Hymenobacter terricola TaxID=2819236 RepID=UPI001B3021E3|nr:hypothetical protein [Hymenobacter terricola]
MRQALFSAAFLAGIWLLTSVSALAQPGSGGPAPGGAPATETPLDGGASLLLAGGVAYALRKLRPRRQVHQRYTRHEMACEKQADVETHTCVSSLNEIA